MNALFEQLAKFGVGRLTAIFGLTIGAAAALVMFTMSMNGSREALLYSGLEPQDAAAVTERLSQANITYSLREGGTAVFVDRQQVDEARLRVAQGGALGFGSVGYEIFDETDALGTTSFVQNINAKRALEGELARTINTIGVVTASRVHLVLPERRLFSQQVQDPSASVILTLRGNITPEQIATVRDLVATAVPGLAAGRITIADDRGRLLASPSEDGSVTSAALEGRRSGLESELRDRVRDVVEGVVGAGAARVVVTANLSRESLTESSQTYDPEGQVRAGREATEEFTREPAGGNRGAVSVSENLPEDAGAAEAENAAMAETGRNVRVENFLNSSTTTTRIVEAGAIERLSVSVVVDEVMSRAEDGSLVFTPRSEEEIARIRQLAAVAAGLDESRGDVIEVAQLRFSRPDLDVGTPAPSGFSLNPADILRIAEIAVLFITALLIVFLVARPLIKGAISGPAPALAAAGAGGGTQALPMQARQAAIGHSSDGQLALPDSGDGDETIDIAHIDGQVKKSSVKKVSSLVERHPDESMAILRTWMHES
ncbi:MAG: flagellar basal-body MS-ring/collar protein FliF [Caulobacterales bacterium]|uniref:flagellar basal-body MS-ring/collar protein FliF n=1 Tax=Glycocaulis sp. TaxID=1969725 RepID=UPI003FA03FE4